MAPDPVASTPRPSLTDRLFSGVRRGDVGRSRAAAIVVALLIVLAPLATWAGAAWTIRRVAADAAALRATAAPTLAAVTARAAARSELAALLDRPGPAATLDTLARALPQSATLVRAGRGDDGRLTVEVLAPDPDRLRAALRRAEGTARLRDTGQRRGEAGMIVALAEPR